MLMTGWEKLAVAGPTIDGREISPEWLKSIAKNYSPEIYTASINEDHWLTPGLGTVQEVKTGKDEQGRLALYGKINPSAEMHRRIEAGQGVFFSAEVRHDFPEEGEHYLTGVAMVDEPASLGLPPTKFSTGTRGELYHQAIPAKFGATPCPEPEKMKSQAQPEVPEETPPWFRNFWDGIKSQFNGANANPSETEPMTKEEKAEFDALKLQVKTQADQLAAFTPAPETDPPAEKAPAKPTELETVQTELAALKEKQAAIDAFMAETTETEALEVTKGADGMPVIY